ncbi:MAG TPA: hypothetical protein VFM74_01610, partial [Candidatus Limnocylindria bacterium]|nr:hypothetical protein [Candidatus Limnocylindria bacterium]
MRRALAAITAGLCLLAIAPPPANAHALGATFQLPVPLWLYLVAAAVAVAASFVVAAVVVRPAAEVPSYPVRRLSSELARGVSALLAAIGVVWWLRVVVVAFLVGGLTPEPAVQFWILLWVGVPIVAVLLGNPWPSLSPFRTLFGALEWAARRAGIERLDAGFRYPAALARWPAVVFLLAGIWSELVLPSRTDATRVGVILLAYTLITLAGMILFGRVAWLRNAELFEILLGWFGRIGPIGRRAADRALCDGCMERCDPDRCVDCPECAAAAEPGERRAELRPWFAGLIEPVRAGWSDAAFIVLALAGVTFDGLLETSAWGVVLDVIFPPLQSLAGAELASVLAGTIGLVGLWLLFLAAFALATHITRRLATPGYRFGRMLGTYAVTLLPIAGGYFIAHYLTEVIQGVQWLPELIGDPLAAVEPSVDWIPIQLVWYLSVGAIVLGHVVAIALAHRLALRTRPGRPLLAGLPLVLL